MLFPSPRTVVRGEGRGRNSDLALLVAAELHGVKRNLRFVFPARPTLRELTTQVQTTFQREAVMLRPEGCEEAATRVASEVCVSHLAVHCPQANDWVRLKSISQLADGAQLYAFQRRPTRRERSRSASRHRSLSASRDAGAAAGGAAGGPEQPQGAARLARLDKLRYVFGCLAEPHARARSPPPSPRGLRAASPARILDCGSGSGGSGGIGPSMSVPLDGLQEKLLRRGAEHPAAIAQSLVSSLGAAANPAALAGGAISLAQFLKWGKRNDAIVDALYARCEALRWVPAAQAEGYAFASRPEAPPAAGTSIGTPAPVPHNLPCSPRGRPPHTPQDAAAVAAAAAAAAALPLHPEYHVEVPPPHLLDSPQHAAAAALLAAPPPLPPAGLSPAGAYAAAAAAAHAPISPREASTAAERRAVVDALSLSPLSALTVDSPPPAAVCPAPVQAFNPFRGGPHAASPAAAGVAGEVASAAHYQTWRRHLIEAEISRLEAEHQQRLAALRADMVNASM